VVLSADTDFGALLAARGSAKPSVALFRGRMSRRPEFLANLLLSQLAALERFLIKGAIVVIEPTRIRVRCPRFLQNGGTGLEAALSGCFEQRRLYLIGHIDGHEPVGRV